jgi:hypothetical protein
VLRCGKDLVGDVGSLPNQDLPRLSYYDGQARVWLKQYSGRDRSLLCAENVTPTGEKHPAGFNPAGNIREGSEEVHGVKVGVGCSTEEDMCTELLIG